MVFAVYVFQGRLKNEVKIGSDYKIITPIITRYFKFRGSCISEYKGHSSFLQMHLMNGE